MKVLGVSGSPRILSNCEVLLDHALRPFAEAGCEAKKVRICDLRVAPCTGCDKCMAGRCVIEDDMGMLLEEFRTCDALIVASPVYYRTPPAQLLAVLQRHYAVRDERPLASKPGGAIAVGRGTGGGQAITLTIIHNWMLSCGMFCVPGELNGVSAQADGPGEIARQANRLRQARILGQNVLDLVRRTNQHTPA